MQTISTIAIPKAITLVKPFTSKSETRPILTHALVTDKYVYATDSHRLIRIRHYDTIEAPYVHSYVEEHSPYSVKSYPNTERLIPDPADAKTYWKDLNVNQFLSLHEEAKPFTSKDKNRVIAFKDNHLVVDRKNWLDLADDFTLDLGISSEIAMRYNCLYMIAALKVFKKLKIKEADLYYYGPNLPFILIKDDVEILILPVR